MSNRVLITGIDSFTGKHLASYLEKFDFDVYGTSLSSSSDKKYRCDITDKNQIINILKTLKPNYFVHLSGISFPAHMYSKDFYKVNTIGTTNILDAILEVNLTLEKVILASSATVYGNQGVEVLDESLCPQPANHYGASKYSMECLARGYFEKLPIVITRPFNYTGVGQSEEFLIPKIVKQFKENKKEIELGNLDVSREFNDVDFVSEVYRRLLESSAKSIVVNIASNRGIRLLDVIEMMESIAGYKMEVKVNPEFVRKDEIKSLTGSSKKLFNIIGSVEQCHFVQTLKKMYEA